MIWKATSVAFLMVVQVALSDQTNLDVSVSFRYPKKTVLKIETYSVKDEFAFSIARTGLADSVEKTPANSPSKMNFHFTPNATETSFVLIVKNTSDKTKYFFASPHTYKPELAALSTVFECLCNHHVYVIPAKKTWYRIVRLSANFEHINSKTKNITMIHDVIEVSEADAKSKYKKLIYEQL